MTRGAALAVLAAWGLLLCSSMRSAADIIIDAAPGRNLIVGGVEVREVMHFLQANEIVEAHLLT